MKLLILIFILISASRVFPVCKRNCPDVKGERELCFVAKTSNVIRKNWKEKIRNIKKDLNNWTDKVGLISMCRSMEVITVSSVHEVKMFLDEVKKNCQIISKLKFSGHANNYSHTSLFSNVDDVAQDYDGYECIFKKNAEIWLDGCNTAKSCRGEAFLFNVAKTFLNISGGTVKGHTAYALNLTFTPSSSINLTNRAITWMPGPSVRAVSNATGLLGQILNDEVCLTTMSAKLNKYNNAFRKAPAKCKKWYHLSTHNIKLARKIIDLANRNINLVDLDKTIEMKTVGRIFEKINYYTYKLKRCYIDTNSQPDDLEDYFLGGAISK